MMRFWNRRTFCIMNFGEIGLERKSLRKNTEDISVYTTIIL